MVSQFKRAGPPVLSRVGGRKPSSRMFEPCIREEAVDAVSVKADVGLAVDFRRFVRLSRRTGRKDAGGWS
jgi:hypothetical protein